MENHPVGQGGSTMTPGRLFTHQTRMQDKENENFSRFNTVERSVGEKLLIMSVLMMEGLIEQLRDRMQEMEGQQIALTKENNCLNPKCGRLRVDDNI